MQTKRWLICSNGNIGFFVCDLLAVIAIHNNLSEQSGSDTIMEKVLVFTIKEDSEELGALLKTLEIRVVGEYLQKRDHAHKIGFLGPGKLDDIEKEAKDLDFDAIVINGILKPSQHHYLEMRFQKECIDRTGVILRIFSEHAHTPEAIAQVTLARLRYEQPFLREWIHKAKKGDRPGFLSGGAYATDVYYEHAKSHARRIEQNLRELSRQRELTRTRRHAKGYSLVSLAGYTNAGKSALFNALCDAAVVVDERLFSTLSTTTRKVLRVTGNVLMVDTVGFINDLPTDLIDAFNSTLEEIFYADLILLVFDASEPSNIIRQKIKVSFSVLLPKITQQKMIVVGNKADLLSQKRRKELAADLTGELQSYDVVLVSAKSGEGLDDLREKISIIQKRSFIIVADLPLTDAAFALVSRLRSICDVSETLSGKLLHVVLGCKSEDGQKIRGWLAKADATEVSANAQSPAIDTTQGNSASSGKEGAPLL